MKGRDLKTKETPSADLLVCFPSRLHLTLMPKPICSPARPSKPNNRHPHHIFIKKLRARNGCGASPLLWAKNKQFGSEITEPTSLKLTCSGNIKVRSKTRSYKSWQSVKEEIERIHNNKMRHCWIEFIACLRSIRLCFGTFPRPDMTSTEGEDKAEEEEEYQENQKHVDSKGEKKDKGKSHDDETAVPPLNALLLMRCRSAPAESWLKDKVKDEENLKKREEEYKRKLQKKTKNLRSLMEEENKKIKERLVVMKFDPAYFKTSSHISRSRSWKR